jgi:hypothetical protein
VSRDYTGRALARMRSPPVTPQCTRERTSRRISDALHSEDAHGE